jgi:hypothetical protein
LLAPSVLLFRDPSHGEQAMSFDCLPLGKLICLPLGKLIRGNRRKQRLNQHTERAEEQTKQETFAFAPPLLAGNPSAKRSEHEA